MTFETETVSECGRKTDGIGFGGKKRRTRVQRKIGESRIDKAQHIHYRFYKGPPDCEGREKTPEGGCGLDSSKTIEDSGIGLEGGKVVGLSTRCAVVR